MFIKRTQDKVGYVFICISCFFPRIASVPRYVYQCLVSKCNCKVNKNTSYSELQTICAKFKPFKVQAIDHSHEKPTITIHACLHLKNFKHVFWLLLLMSGVQYTHAAAKLDLKFRIRL